MTLLNDADVIRELLRRFQSRNIAVPCFCAENTYTVEGISITAGSTVTINEGSENANKDAYVAIIRQEIILRLKD